MKHQVKIANAERLVSGLLVSVVPNRDLLVSVVPKRDLESVA